MTALSIHRTPEQQKEIPAFIEKFKAKINLWSSDEYTHPLGGTVERLTLWKEYIELLGLREGAMLDVVTTELGEVSDRLDEVLERQRGKRIIITHDATDTPTRIFNDFMVDTRNIADAYNALVDSYKTHIDLSQEYLAANGEKS